MTNNQDPNRTILPRQTGFFTELTDRFRLISRLMMDSRVNPLVKLLPVGALAYAVWPIDVPGPVDDAVVLWLGTTLFVQLCPPDVVDEHMQNIRQGYVGSGQGKVSSNPGPDEEIVDGEFFETDPNKQKSNQNYPH